MSVAKNRNRVNRLIGSLVLFIVGMIMLFPLLAILNISLKTESEFLNFPIRLVREPHLQNFIDAWKNGNMGVYFFNSVYITLVVAISSTLFSALASFPISRKHIKHHQLFFMIFLASMYLPTSFIANIFLLKTIGLINTHLGLILIMSSAGMTLNVFIFTGYIRSIPTELDDAAIIDGCGYIRYFFSIVVHLMKPALATVLIIRLISAWNEFVSPLLYISDRAKRTLTSGIYIYMGTYSNRWTLLTASLLMVAIPMVIAYVLLQRFIIDGMTAGSIKG